MLNLIIAVVLDNFSSASHAEERKVTDEHVKQFKKVWSHFDPKGTCSIAIAAFPRLVALLPPPLGLYEPGVHITRAALVRFQVRIHPVHLFALGSRVPGTHTPGSFVCFGFKGPARSLGVLEARPIAQRKATLRI
jgi:hypothetical protein